MSNALAIASVTETLVQVLAKRLPASGVAGATVTAVRPDLTTQLPEPGVNVFLYQVTPNSALRNADLPTRDAQGKLLKRPQVALDLNYLITFHGDDTRLEQQRLLGAVATQMHAYPTLGRTAVQNAQTSVAWLADADLEEQAELVRFTPIIFSLEELSKLWSFLLKIDYVLSVAYQASVVLMQTDDVEPPPPLKVLSWNVLATPYQQPVIREIGADAGDMIVPASTLLVSGQHFVLYQPAGSGAAQAPAPPMTLLLIDGAPTTPASTTPTQLRAPLPAGLAAGVHTAQIGQALLLGTPPVPHPSAVRSGLAAFVLHPVIRRATQGGAFEIEVDPAAGSPAGITLSATLDPAIQPGQHLLLELFPADAPTVSRLFDGGTAASASDTARFTFIAPAAGEYLVRVWIDDAESPMQLGPGGVPNGPSVTL